MVSPQGGHHSSDAKWCSRHHAAKEQWSNRPQLNRKDNHIILTLKRQFIMTKETKENVQIVSAIAMLIGDFSSLSQDSSYRPPDRFTSLSWVYSQSVLSTPGLSSVSLSTYRLSMQNYARTSTTS